jgi:hypothetical protein
MPRKKIADGLNSPPASTWWADASPSMTFHSNHDLRHEILHKIGPRFFAAFSAPVCEYFAQSFVSTRG